MSEKKKISRINKLLICLIIMFIIVTIHYVFVTNETNNENVSANNNAINELTNINNDNTAFIGNNVNNTEEFQEELNFYSEEVQNILPFTGAFPTSSLAYLTKLRNIQNENINNDFVLKLAFSKVTKEDWAESYIAEGEKVSIDASILDKYVKQIFGEIDYKYNDFSNKDIKYDNSIAGIYEAKYNEEENNFYIDVNTGDVDESIIEFLYPKAIKYSDRIELLIHPIYIKNYGESQDSEGNSSFSYIAYKHYNYETESFVSRLTDTMNEIWQYNEETGKNEYNKLIQGIQEKDLETYTLTYKYNDSTKKYEFESMISK